MTNNERLTEISNLLGSKLTDKNICQFLDEFGTNALATIDSSDGANDEYVEFKEHGYCLYFDEGILVSIFLHSGECNTDYLKFSVDLPESLKFEMSNNDVLNSFGNPKVQGGGNDPFWGEVPHWVKYELNDYFLHIEFHENLNSIRLITLSIV